MSNKPPVAPKPVHKQKHSLLHEVMKELNTGISDTFPQFTEKQAKGKRKKLLQLPASLSKAGKNNNSLRCILKQQFGSIVSLTEAHNTASDVTLE